MLSSHFWLVLLDELVAKLSAEGYDCLGCADDLAIVVRGRYAETIMDRTQGALNLVND